MHIKTTQISDYRNISNPQINMDDNFAIIAGANNSKKPSLIEFFNHIFVDKKGQIYCDDFPVRKRQERLIGLFPQSLLIINIT